MGSFTALELARRGASVIGFDRFSPPHEHGSHGGETRAFRTIYTEHPDYVPLMKRALELWERLAAEDRPDLLTWTGVLSLGESDSPLLDGVQQSADVHGLPVQVLSADEVRSRFPALNPPENFAGLLDDRAGLIDVAAALDCALRGARRRGAELGLLIAGDRLQLVFANLDGPGRYRAWARQDTLELFWPEVEVTWEETRSFERARRSVPVLWHMESADGTLSGVFESVSSHVQALEGDGAILPVLAVYEVAGRITVDEEEVAVKGFLRHFQR